MPKTHYARSGDVSIAYQVFGDGPDLVFIPGSYAHLELQWEFPHTARFFERLASFCRVMIFDKRGTGMSDRNVGVPTLEEEMDDVLAVLDAVGSERAAMHGSSEGGPMGALFAATYPERTTHLVLYGTFPRVTAAPGWPGIPSEDWSRSVDEMVAAFPDVFDVETYAPSLANDPGLRELWAREARMATSPGSLRALMTMIGDIDVRPILPTISVPTLVLHREGDRVVPAACGMYLASVIPGARMVTLSGEDHYIGGNIDPWIEAVEEFVTGAVHRAAPDRVLATVVFTDIVGSTEAAARLGDAGWHQLLDRHDITLRRAAAAHSGRVVKTLGDGGLVTFDGPARAVRFASEFSGAAQALGMSIRAGIHTGEIEVRGEDIGGIAVHIAARISALAGPGEVLSSRTVKDLTAGSGLRFDDRGTHQLKGVPDEWQVFAAAC